MNGVHLRGELLVGSVVQLIPPRALNIGYIDPSFAGAAGMKARASSYLRLERVHDKQQAGGFG